jgi:Acyl-CoA dehydrogenase, C-terminal domain
VDLSLTEEEEQLVAAVAALFRRGSGSSDGAPGDEPAAFDSTLWGHLVALGVPSMAAAADPSVGAASLLQLALVAEQAGRALAPAPVVEGFVATRILDRTRPASDDLLGRVAAGEVIATADLAGGPAAVPRLVSAGAVAQLIVGVADHDLVAAVSDPPGRPVANLGSLPLARRDLASGHVTVLAEGEQAAAAIADARRDWRVLSAALLVGMSGAALDLGVAYSKSREVFGAPIATFQTIAHRLADHATAVDGARLLVAKAAWAADQGRGDAEALASMAWCFAGEASGAVTADCLHYHGGYGFTVEYDIQRYFRQAKAVVLTGGDPRSEIQALADLLLPLPA